MDADSGQGFYFIEVNPRIQVEHTVTELRTRGSTWSRRRSASADGGHIGQVEDELDAAGAIARKATGVPAQADIHINVRTRCSAASPPRTRRTTSLPDYGTIHRLPFSAGGFGVRLDAGTAYSGAIITPFYDSLLVKVTCLGADTAGDHRRAWIASLREFRIRGVA